MRADRDAAKIGLPAEHALNDTAPDAVQASPSGTPRFR
jgi:hypothetical protein